MSWSWHAEFFVKCEFLADWPELAAAACASLGVLCLVLALAFVAPFVACGKCLLASEWGIILGGCFIVSKWADLNWEELTIFSCLLHVFDDARHKFFVFLLGVLLVENAVLVFVEANAAKAVVAGASEHTILQIRRLWPDQHGELHVIICWAAHNFVAEFCVWHADAVCAVFGVYAKNYVFAVLTIHKVKAVFTVFASNEVIAGRIFAAFQVCKLVRKLETEFFEFLFEIHRVFVSRENSCLCILKLFFTAGFIEKVVLFVSQVHATNTVLAASASVRKISVCTSAAFLQKAAAVTFLHVHAFITKFRVTSESAVCAVTAAEQIS